MRTALLKDWTGPLPFKYGKLERKFLFGGEHMNPMNLLQLKPAWNQFKANHPKMLSFESRIQGRGHGRGDPD